jgi:hypothetical protein
MMRLPDVSPAQLALGTLTALLLFGSTPVMGHALLVAPQPRDQQDGYKDPPRAPPGTGAPCGVMRSAMQPRTTFMAGQPLHVQWTETVTHPGCFVIDFASANDAAFQVLGVKSHSTAAGNPPRAWSLDVVLPAAPCAACTLRLRQLMLPADVPETQCPPTTIPLGSTYYSCSNVTLTGTGTADGGTPDARADAGGSAGRAGSGGGGAPGSSGGAAGGPGTGGAAAASGGSTVANPVTGTGGATASSSGGSAAGSGGANGATGGSSASATGGSNPSSSSQNSGGGCSVSGAASSESIASIVSALCLAGAFIRKRRRPADTQTKERLQ